MLRRLHPDPVEQELRELYTGLTLPAGSDRHRTWVALCMVASVDGAVAVDGLSGGLGGEADLLALSRLRASNDVSLVGAGTVRMERYRPLTGSTRRREDRAERGLRAAPRLAIVSRSGQLDPELPVFDDPDERPLLLTCERADPAALARLEDRAEIHVLGEGTVPIERALDHLADLGLPRVLCEGGPRLNQTVVAADRVDEVFLTLAPALVGGPAARIVHGDRGVPHGLALVSVFESDGDLLLRYQHRDHHA